MGEIGVTIWRDGRRHQGILKNVLHVPGLGTNLFSVGAAADNNFETRFYASHAHILLDGKVIITGTRVNKKLYRLNITPILPITPTIKATALLSVTKSSNIWHQRLVHVNKEIMKKMVKEQLLLGFTAESMHYDSPCLGCEFGKSHRLPFQKDGRERATNIGGIVHSDVCGPMEQPSPGGARTNYVLFKDDLSGFCITYFMKNKSEVLSHFKTFMHRMKGETNNEGTTFG